MMKKIILACALILLTACGGYVAHSIESPHVAKVSVALTSSTPGWSRDKVAKYDALKGICAEAWKVIVTTFEENVTEEKGEGVTSNVTTVTFTGVKITYVTFTSGFHAWHLNPYHGIVVIDDPYDRQVYP